jgi:hypothetical protein
MSITFFLARGRAAFLGNAFQKLSAPKFRPSPMKYLFHLALVVCLVNIHFAYANDVNDLFEFQVQPDNPQTEKRYVGKQTRDFLSIYDTVIKRTIWKVYKGNGEGHGIFVLLAIGPNANYAVVSREYAEKGQTLYWINLARRYEGNVIELDTSALDEWAAKTLKVPIGWLSQVYYDPKRWLRDNTCAVFWECTSPGKGGDATMDLHNDGVVLLSCDPGTSKRPTVTMVKYVAGMSDEEWYKFDESTLFDSQHSGQRDSTKRKQ